VQKVYSRYADDLAFSTNEPGVLTHLPQVVRQELFRLPWPRIALNEDKTVYTSKKYRRTVTGLVLSSQGHVSMGRDRKRLIRAMVHRFELGELDEAGALRLRGLLAFASDVEPEFIERIGNSVGTEIIRRIVTGAKA
jgi:hypothetical protein